ncbi:uncharacterized protein BJ171DRAFT_506791 [Polychytrium aggregatum]|uniref:uncharacterized protein n=1 Tax=Polychytrium aggregatum TaxID=110093 RepID=UPI0022FDDB56|nr:uncharacterized protein BJ171DRAFT_506791 [Polychytrium aggregatum]KAI9204259.1 hypothetical protein BJ171DRAFT_506791 [Polychytrium aggregatum]
MNPSTAATMHPILSRATSQEIQVLYSQFKNSLDLLIDHAAKTPIPELESMTTPLTERPPGASDKSIEEGTVYLGQVCSTMEEIFSHGFMAKRSWLRTRTVWDFIEETLRKYSSEQMDVQATLATVNTMTEANPSMRTKVWIRLTLMQQTLGDHIHTLIANRTVLAAWYEPWAFLMQPDKADPLIGMLQGLTQLEFNLYLKDESSELLTESKSRAPSTSTTNAANAANELLKTGIAGIGSLTESINISGIAASLQTKVETVRTDGINLLAESLKSRSLPVSSRGAGEASEELEKLRTQLEAERNIRVQLEVQILSMQRAKDDDELKFKSDLAKMEQKVRELAQSLELNDNRLKATREELAHSLRDQADLNAQLDRARMAARIAKVQLEKLQKSQRTASGSQSQDSAESLGSAPRSPVSGPALLSIQTGRTEPSLERDTVQSRTLARSPLEPRGDTGLTGSDELRSPEGSMESIGDIPSSLPTTPITFMAADLPIPGYQDDASRTNEAAGLPHSPTTQPTDGARSKRLSAAPPGMLRQSSAGQSSSSQGAYGTKSAKKGSRNSITLESL